MRIRRCSSLLLGAAVSVSATCRFELPPSPQFELPPPAHESNAGFASNTSFSPEPCPESFFPWDLMNQLNISDPQEEERFVETYSIPVAKRASWLFPISMQSARSIKEDEEDMVNVVKDEEEEDMVNGSILEQCAPKDVRRKNARKKNESKPKMKKGKEKAEESHESRGEFYTCKKNDGKRWFCRRLVSQPDSLCLYHSDPKLLGSSKLRRRRSSAFGDAVGGGFYYYAGFGSSRSKRHRGSSSRSVLEPAPAEEKEEAQLPEEHIDVTPGQAQDDGAHGIDDAPKCDDDGVATITGYDEEISSDGNIKKKCPVKKRKSVNTRLINSLM